MNDCCQRRYNDACRRQRLPGISSVHERCYRWNSYVGVHNLDRLEDTMMVAEREMKPDAITDLD